MPIKNYTTEIAPVKSAGQIQALLAKAGVSAVSIAYSNGQPSGLTFAIAIDGREFYYRIPARAEGVLKTLQREAQPRFRNMDHARCVAWRIVHDWVASQLALIQAGAADLGEVFLPYLMTSPTETVYDRFISGGGLLALPSGRPEDSDV